MLMLGTRLSDGVHHDILAQRVCDEGISVVVFGPDRLNDGRVTVLKSLRRPLLNIPDIYERFVDEGLQWTSLWPHPNIVGVYGVAVMDEAVLSGQPFIVLEYAERGNLRDWLDHGWVTREMALTWAQCIAAGLTYLHEPDPAHLRPEPIAHGKLKPENVLIQANGVACLTDFGLTSALALADHPDAVRQILDANTDQTVSMGAPAYMAPEQWVSYHGAGTPADVYALGVMFYELFAGQPPLLDPGRDHGKRAWRRAHETLAPLPLRAVDPSLPEALETLALACLAKDPHERPSALEVWQRLQEIARILGMQVWQAPEVVSHSPYNELVYWSNWSCAYACFERWEEALERNSQALRVAPQAAPTLRARGDILVGLQRYEEAEGAYQTALQSASDDRERGMLWGQLGTMHNEAGNDARWAEDYPRAIARCEQADAAYARQMELAPQDAGAPFNRAANQRLWALAEKRLGRVAAAVEHLKLARIYATVAVRWGDTAASGYVRTITDHLRQLGESSDADDE
jgi:serine/threonine protein kinase